MGTLNGYDVDAEQRDGGLLFSRDLVGQGQHHSRGTSTPQIPA